MALWIVVATPSADCTKDWKPTVQMGRRVSGTSQYVLVDVPNPKPKPEARIWTMTQAERPEVGLSDEDARCYGLTWWKLSTRMETAEAAGYRDRKRKAEA